MKNFDLDAIKKDAKKMAKQTSQHLKKTNEIIATKYDGDEDAYFKDTFNMASASLLLDMSIEEIRINLIEKLDNGSHRKEFLLSIMNNGNMEQRLCYPGGYNAFVEDVNNKYYGDITIEDINKGDN